MVEFQWKVWKQILFYTKCLWISYFLQIFTFVGSSVICLSLSEIPIWTHQREFGLLGNFSRSVWTTSLNHERYMWGNTPVRCYFPFKRFILRPSNFQYLLGLFYFPASQTILDPPETVPSGQKGGRNFQECQVSQNPFRLGALIA